MKGWHKPRKLGKKQKPFPKDKVAPLQVVEMTLCAQLVC